MMSKTVLRLFPPPAEEIPLRSLYLDLGLHRIGTPSEPFVYANFLTSLDGRIALEDARGETYLPKQLTTSSDFRLFVELEAQADCLITHGGYLRALAAGRLGNILQIGLDPRHGDLAEWRAREGLTPQPAIVIASASLDFPMPDSIARCGQTCYIATGRGAEPGRVAAWRDLGYEILIAGEHRLVDGAPLVRALGERGYRSIYLIAGPQMLDTMLRTQRLRRLFQTITHQLLGGRSFRTLLPGAEMGGNGEMKLLSLYYDPHEPAGTGQWFAQFQRLRD